jgi:chemotaxis protein MotB
MSGDSGGIPEEHEEHANHEAWVIPYADLLTLLMAMFIALFAMSSVDTTKFKALALGFNQALNGPSLDTGVFSKSPGNTPLDGQGSGLAPQPGGAIGPDKQPKSQQVLPTLAQQHANLEAQRSVERQSLDGVRKQIATEAKRLGLAGELSLRLEERGLVVTVVTDQVLFDTGSATLKPEGQSVLRVVVSALKSIDNPILIEGHTDSTPIATAQYPSNWELSSGRAGSVARFFESLGMNGARMRPEGLADHFPIASNATAAGQAQNRRVEIVVQSKLVARALRDAGLTNEPVTAPVSPIGNPVGVSVNPNLNPIRR